MERVIRVGDELERRAHQRAGLRMDPEAGIELEVEGHRLRHRIDGIGSGLCGFDAGKPLQEANSLVISLRKRCIPTSL